MKTAVYVLLMAQTWLLTACLGPDPAVKAALARRVAELPQSAATYGPPGMAAPRPLKPGQWVQMKRVDSGGAVSLTTTKIVGQEGPAFWTEIETETYDGRATIKSLIDPGDPKDPSTRKILAIKMKDKEGRVMEYPASSVAWMQSLAPTLDTVKWDGFQQEDVQVQAGRFAKAYRGAFTAGVALLKSSGTAWWHPDVPINGVVKIVGDSGLFGGTSELVAFGETGATSAF